MTKEILEDYRYKLMELRRYNQGKENVTDTVIGSSSEYPYTSHPISISGVPEERNKMEAELKEQCASIKRFIAELPNSYYRLLVQYRIMEGLEWKDIGSILNKSENAVKKDYSRLLRKLK